MVIMLVCTLTFSFEKKNTLTITLHYDLCIFSRGTKCLCNIISYCFVSLLREHTTFRNYIACSKI